MSYYTHPTGSYPYGSYHHTTPQAYQGHQQTPGAYPTTAYQTPYPTAGGYGTTWPYPYGYYQQPTAAQHQQQQAAAATAARPAVSTPTATTSTAAGATTTTTVAASTSTPTSIPPPVVPQRVQPTPTTYSAYQYVPREPVAVGAAKGRKQAPYRGLFTKELRNLMYGFGDDRNPANDTVNVMEEILVEYIIDVCQTALAPGKKARLSIEDLRRALSRPADAKKLARMEELLFMQEDIKRARAQFEESDMNQAGSYQS